MEGLADAMASHGHTRPDSMTCTDDSNAARLVVQVKKGFSLPIGVAISRDFTGMRRNAE